MYLFFLVLEFFLNRTLNRFWIFVPATPATHTLFVGIQWVGFISMLALYVYASCCWGVSFHVDMLYHLRGVEMSEELTLYWSLLDGRYLATYAAEGSEGTFV